MDFNTIIFLIIAFFTGSIVFSLAEKFKVSILLLAGVLFGFIADFFSISIDKNYFIYIGFLAFSLYIFEYLPELRFSRLDFEKKHGVMFAVNSLVACLIAGYLTYLLTNQSLFGVFVFAILMFVSQIYYETKLNRLSHLLHFESSISIVFALVFLFFFFDFKNFILASEFVMLAESLFLSIGLGILFGLIALKFAGVKHHQKAIAFILVILAFAISSWIAFPAITLLVFALIFTVFASKKMSHTFSFFAKINRITEIFVLIGAGYLFYEKFYVFDLKFIFLAATIYALFFFMRWFVIHFFAMDSKEKVFVILNNPKGTIGALLFLLLMLIYPREYYLWCIYFVIVFVSELVSNVSHKLENTHALKHKPYGPQK